MEEFNNTILRLELGNLDRLQPYNFERYKAVNPNLTEKMYRFLRGNGTEWKILCGEKVVMKYENEVLQPVWYLKNDEIYKNRYNPDYYLNLTTW